jgi:hypothetical protein
MPTLIWNAIIDWLHKKNLSAHIFVVALPAVVGLYKIPEVHDLFGPYLTTHAKAGQLVLVALAIYARYSKANVPQ